MTDPFAFTVDADPVGKGRPRATTIGGFARLYTPAKTRKYEALVSATATAAMVSQRRQRLDGPLKVTIVAAFTLPKSKERKRQPVQGSWHVGKPDADNVAKAVLDAIEGVVFAEDAAVCELVVTKRTAAQGVPGSVAVRVESQAAVPA